MTKLSIKSAIIILLISLLTSCVKEDRSDCPICYADVSMKLEYYADTKKNVITQYVESANLYIYNKKEGKLLKELKLLKKDFANGAKIKIEGLTEGEYTFVLWGNITEDTDVQQPQNIQQARLSPKGYVDNEVVTTNDALYFARNDFSVGIRKNNDLTMELKSSHLNFEISISGVTQLPEIKADNLAPLFDMNNQPVGPEDCIYHPEMEYSDTHKVYQAKFRVLKPKLLIDSKIHITFAGNSSLHIEDVNAFIAKHYPDYRLTERQEITFRMLIELTESGISVVVPDWAINESGSAIE